MKKTVLNDQTAQQVISRVAQLEPTNKPDWGRFTVSEMLFHCTLVNNEILKGTPTEIKPTVKQRMIKFVALNLMKQFPKGVQTGKKYLKQEDQSLDFETEKSNLIQSIEQFSNYKDPIYGIHPFFGPLKTNEWKRFVWMHLDHHLRQFSV